MSTIFVVEDGALTSALLQQHIEAMGHQFVGKADNGVDALEQIEQLRPDLVLMDINLRGDMDGIEVATQLRDRETAGVIYLTAFSDEAILERARLTEPYGYLVKPFNRQSLQASVEMGLYKSEVEQRQRRIFDGVVQVIAGLVGQRDPFLGSVQMRTALLAEAMAIELKWSAQEQRGIRMAAMLHGIGLASVPVELLNRPAPLQGVEKQMFETHPEAGYQRLKDIAFPYPVAEVVYQHMERLDGSGYPRALRGDAILPGARLLAVASVVTRALTPTMNRAPVDVAELFAQLMADQGEHYDVEMVEACRRLLLEKGFAWPPEAL